MATLGTLSILAKIEGAAQVISDLKKIQEQGTSTNNSLKNSTNLASRAASDLNSTFGSQSISIKSVNKDFLDLVQTMSLLSKGGGFKNPFEGMFKTAGSSVDQLQSVDDKIKDIELSMKRLNMPFPEGPKSPKNIDYLTGAKNTPESRARIDAKNAENQEKYAKNLARYQEAVGLKTEENSHKMDKYKRILFDLTKQQGNLLETTVPLLSMFTKYGPIIDKLSGAYETLSGVFKALIVDTFKFYSANFSLAVPVITMLGKAAIKSASDLELMLMKMAAINKSKMIANEGPSGFAQGSSGDITYNSSINDRSMIAAKNMFDYVKKLAIPSTYTADQIFESSQQMEAFGLNTKKSLLTAVSLAETFGGTQQTLEMITRMMGRMAAGELPDARAFGKFGMNKALMSKILGKDVADATGEEMLKAFGIMTKRISGDTLNSLQTVTSAKMATLQEKMNLALAAIGQPMLGPFNNLINKILGLLDKLESSGILKEIGTQIGRIFDEIAKPENWANIEKIVADIAGWFLRMVENTRIMVRGFIGMYFIAKEALKIYIAFKTKGASIVLGALEATQRTKNPLKMLYGENYAMPNLADIGTGLSSIFGRGDVLQPYPVEANNMAQKMMQTRKQLESGVVSSNVVDINKMMADQENLPYIMDQVLANAEKQNDKLDKIKDNTKSTADELSLRKAAMGGRGGPLNQLGMSPTQVAFAGNVNMDRSAFQDPTLMNPISMLEKAIVDIVRRNDSKTFRRF
jgi:hypothetical protein